MATRINNNGRTIAVSSKNGYTIEKVQKAVEFVKHATRRGTKFEDYLNMYNYLKGTNEVLPNCKVCGAAKFIAAVENYAKYGYLTLVANGVDPDILNGNKKEDGGLETKIGAVESQKTAQSVGENGEGEGNTSNDNSMDNAEENATESKENVSTDADKATNKRSKKKA